MTEFFSELDWLANLAELIGFCVLLWTFFNVYVLRTEQRLGNKKITLLLEVEGKPSISYTLPSYIRRKDFSRQEVMGRLGMIPLEDTDKRFDLRYVQKNPNFLKEIEDIYNRKDDAILKIYCSEKEYQQFDFS